MGSGTRKKPNAKKNVGFFIKNISNLENFARKVFRLIYKNYDEFILHLDFDKISEVKSLSSITANFLKKENTHLLVNFYRTHHISMPNPESVVTDYFNRGCECMVATLNNEIIAFAWCCYYQGNLDGKEYMFQIIRNEFGMKKKDVYGIFFYVSPDSRQHNNAMAALSKMFYGVKQAGYSSFYTSVLASHKAARWVDKRLGMKEIKAINIKRFFCLFYLIKGSLFLKLGENYHKIRGKS